MTDLPKARVVHHPELQGVWIVHLAPGDYSLGWAHPVSGWEQAVRVAIASSWRAQVSLGPGALRRTRDALRRARDAHPRARATPQAVAVRPEDDTRTPDPTPREGRPDPDLTGTGIWTGTESEEQHD